MQSDVIVTVCSINEVPAARALLLGNSAEYDRSSLTAHAETAECDEQKVLVAIAGGQLVGAVYHEVGAGRVGWMWPPAVAASSTSSSTARQICRALVAQGADRLARQGACLIQVLLQPNDRNAAVMLGCGFRRITEIIQMERPTAGAMDIESKSCSELITFSESLRGELYRVVEQTYASTLDCPELDGARPISDVLEGYQAAGEFREGLWSLARCAGEFVGCVLLCFFPESEVASLQYMGVVAASRRRGIGRQLTDHALRVAGSVGARTITLAVDVRNTPARRLYRDIGFQETWRRSVFIMRV